MIRIGIVGTFWLSETFSRALWKVKGVELCAVCSRTLEKAKKFITGYPDAVAYDDPKKMAMDKSIDAVYLAIPNAQHYELSKLFLTAGKHVLCEKPICVHIEEYDELNELARSKHLVYLEAMMNCHVPQIDLLKRVLSEAGAPVTARIDFCQRSSKIERVRAGETFSTFSRAACGGALMDLGVYSAYFVLNLFGYPKSVTAKAVYLGDVDCTDTIILEYDGFHAVLTMSKLAESSIRSEIICENGTVTLSGVSQLQEIVYIPAGGKKQPCYGRNDFATSMAAEIADFAEYINGKNYDRFIELSRDSIRLLTEIRKQIGYDI